MPERFKRRFSGAGAGLARFILAGLASNGKSPLVGYAALMLILRSATSQRAGAQIQVCGCFRPVAGVSAVGHAKGAGRPGLLNFRFLLLSAKAIAEAEASGKGGFPISVSQHFSFLPLPTTIAARETADQSAPAGGCADPRPTATSRKAPGRGWLASGHAAGPRPHSPAG